ncbi:MAG: hypothetical protein ABSA93_10605 [Streptosporangiaceae bacterium]|jgi:hypothetical protein
MTQRRGPVIAWSGSVAGIAFAAAALIAVLQKQPFADPILWPVIGLGVAAAVLTVIAGVPDLVAWTGGGVRAVTCRARRPRHLETGRWVYTTVGTAVPVAASTALEVALPGTRYMQQAEARPPRTRYAILLGCSQVGPEFDAREARSRFLAFLAEPLIATLVSTLTRVPPGAVWQKRAAHPAAFDCVLTCAGDDDAVAAARLELPDGVRRYGRDLRYATLIFHVEPGKDAGISVDAAEPGTWTGRITQVLQAAPALAGFLSGTLGLQISPEVTAWVAVRLEAPKDIAELIDATGLDPLPGGQRLREVTGYLAAAGDGVPAPDAAARMVRDAARYALKADA